MAECSQFTLFASWLIYLEHTHHHTPPNPYAIAFWWSDDVSVRLLACSLSFGIQNTPRYDVCCACEQLLFGVLFGKSLSIESHSSTVHTGYLFSCCSCLGSNGASPNIHRHRHTQLPVEWEIFLLPNENETFQSVLGRRGAKLFLYIYIFFYTLDKKTCNLKSLQRR